MRNVSEKVYRKSKHILYSLIFIFENLSVYEIMWENMVETDRRQMAI
jgi:hypothetical protein